MLREVIDYLNILNYDFWGEDDLWQNTQENMPDQVHMGSDHLWGFPVGKEVQWIQTLPGLTEEFRKKIFETNPRKFYKFILK